MVTASPYGPDRQTAPYELIVARTPFTSSRAATARSCSSSRLGALVPARIRSRRITYPRYSTSVSVLPTALRSDPGLEQCIPIVAEQHHVVHVSFGRVDLVSWTTL